MGGWVAGGVGVLFAVGSGFCLYRRTKREMQIEWAQLDAWIEASPVGIVVFNEASEIVRLNAEAARLLKGEALEFFGKKQGELLQCVHWRDAPKGCGSGSSCLTCPLRQAIGTVLAEKKSLPHMRFRSRCSATGWCARSGCRSGRSPSNLTSDRM